MSAYDILYNVAIIIVALFSSCLLFSFIGDQKAFDTCAWIYICIVPFLYVVVQQIIQPHYENKLMTRIAEVFEIGLSTSIFIYGVFKMIISLSLV